MTDPQQYWWQYVCQRSHQIWDHSGVWSKVLLVFEDFKLKISEGSDQNQGRDRKTSILLVALRSSNTPKTLKLHATFILKVLKKPELANVHV
jgi:hypothetical protein